MPEDEIDATVETTEDEETEAVDETVGETEEEDKPLGPAGEKALAAERANVRAARKEAREAKAALAAMQAQLDAKDKPTDEQERDRIQREAEANADKRVNERLVRSEIKVAATGRLADPADAIAFLNLADFDVDENGDVDVDAISDAIDELLTKKPHLAANGGKRFGNVNQNPKAPAKPSQLSRAEYNALSREGRREAREAGRVNHLLGIN